MPRFTLVTLGTLQLQDSSGPGVSGDGPRRRRLALLAVLAASGDRSRSRDWLQALFWPEVEQQRARHSLEQLLYAMRGSLHQELFLGVSPLRLNPQVITSDVGEMERATAEGRHADAAALYAGPFLDGFHLTDAPEFQRWTDGERARLRQAFRHSLETLARTAEQAGDAHRAVEWWRRLAADDPLDSRVAEALIRALADAGDRVGALRHADKYAALVARELETTVSREIGDLVAELRGSGAAAGRFKGSTPAPSVAAIPPFVRAVPPPERGAAATVQSSGSRWRVIAGLGLLLLLLVAGWSAWRVQAGRATTSPEAPAAAPIAVLPIRPTGPNAADRVLADGLTHELIAALARHGMRTVSSTSVYALQNQNLDVRRLADTLGARYLLEGSIMQTGERARMYVRLIDGRLGTTQWSGTYAHELDDWFAVQQDVAGAVANALGVQFTEGERADLQHRPTRNVAAYELYLRGQDLTLFRTEGGLRERLRLFEQAVALDSNFAEAHAGVAYSYAAMSAQGHRRFGPIPTLRARAIESARRAVALDPRLAEAHAVLGAASLIGLADLATAERHLRIATELPGPSRAREHLVMAYIALGRPDLALAEARRAHDADPLLPTAAAELAHALLANRRCDEALAILRPLAQLEPPLLRVDLYAALCHAMHERWDEAVAMMQGRQGPRGRAWRAYALARAGRVGDARAELRELHEQWRRGDAAAFELVVVHLGLSEFDEAFRFLDRSVEELSIRSEVMEPLFNELRADPRFATLRRRWDPAGT